MTDVSSFSYVKKCVLALLLCTIGALGVLSVCSATASLVFLLIFLLFSIVLIKPITGVYLILFFLPMLNLGFTYGNPVRANDEFVPVVVIPILLTLLVCFVRKPLFTHRETKETALDSPAHMLFLFFLGYALTSMSWTIDVQHGINKIYMVLFGFAVYKLIPKLVTSKEAIQRILKIFVFIGIILAIELLLSGKYSDYRYELEIFKDVKFIVTLHTFGDEESLRLGGFAPSDIAADILAMIIFFNIILMYNGKWKTRILLIVHTLLMFYCMLKTASKAGIGSLLIGISALPLIIRELRDRIIRLTTAGIIVVAGLILVAGNVLIKRIQIMMSGKVSFLEDRIGWWKQGFEYLLSTWSFGLGAGGFARIIDPIPAAHNFYFSILFEYGIIGFVLFVSFIGVIIYRITVFMPRIVQGDLRFATGCLLGILVSIFIHGFVELEYTYLTLWFLLGFMVAIQKVSLREGHDI